MARPQLLVALALAVTAVGCGDADPGNPYRMHPIDVSPTEPGDEEPASAPAAERDSEVGASSSSDDDPAERTGDPPPAPSAFVGADAYAAATGPSTRKASHEFAGATPTTNPAGRPCLNCHGAAGPAPRFAFAGTVYKDALGTPAAQVEVRVLGSDGVARVAFTNADGNFFFRHATGAVKYPASAGARDADTTKGMTTEANDGNCNSCHRASGQANPLFVE